MAAVKVDIVHLFCILFIARTLGQATADTTPPKCLFPKSPNCNCFPQGDNIDLACPNNGDSFRTSYQQQQYGNFIEMECSCDTARPPNPSIFSYLKEIAFDHANYWSLKYCPLPPQGFANFMANWSDPSLIQKIYFRSCGLPKFSLSTFSNLTVLTILDLRNNKIPQSSLPPGIFQPLTGLKDLWLMGNQLDSVGQLFRDLKSLRFLQLGSNNLSELDEDSFVDLENLTHLYLGSNLLRNIPGTLLLSLRKLELLDLTFNQIDNLSEDVFVNNLALEILDMKFNQLTSLPSGLFRNNRRLKELILMGNKNVTSLPGSLFENTLLEKLDLSDCNLSLLEEGIFSSLSQLTILNLSRNQLERLSVTLLSNLTNLTSLNLSNNKFKGLGTDWFTSLSQLQTLDLSSNRIESIAAGSFTGLKNLKELNLRNNQLSKLEGRAFRGMANLKQMDLSDNHLTLIHQAAMEPLSNLKQVNLARNRLTLSEGISEDYFGRYSPFNKNLLLERIDLSDNLVAEMLFDWHNLFFLTHLNLTRNKLTSLSFNDLNFTPNSNLVIDLSHNLISNMNFYEASLLDSADVSVRAAKKTVKLDGNALDCNCDTLFLAQYMNQTMRGVAHSWTIDAPTLTCQTPAVLGGVRPAASDPKLFLCPCDVDFAPCSCYRRPVDKMMLLQCHDRNLTTIPAPIPSVPGYKWLVNLTGNRIDLPAMMKDHTLTSVTELDLSANHLDSSSLFHHPALNWSSVMPLRLPHLLLLDVSGNNLSSIPRAVLDVWNASLSLTVALGNNPWTCDCANVPLLNFVTRSHFRIRDINRVSCLEGALLYQLTYDDICDWFGLTFIAAATSISLLLFILSVVTFVVVFRYRRELRAWSYTHLPSCVSWNDDDDDEDLQYDAFVSYAHEDEDFVNQQLVPNLEQPSNSHLPSYRLCLHYRDWLAGQWIPDQITQSVANSKRTLIILSEHFVTSVWGQHEFRTAYEQMLRDKQMRLIIIVLGDMPAKDKMSKELNSYLSLNTYIKWGDGWFWDRLRYALPHKKRCAPVPSSRIAAILEHGSATSPKEDVGGGHIKRHLPPLPLPATPLDKSQVVLPPTPTSSASSTAPIFPTYTC